MYPHVWQPPYTALPHFGISDTQRVAEESVLRSIQGLDASEAARRGSAVHDVEGLFNGGPPGYHGKMLIKP